MISVEDSH